MIPRIGLLSHPPVAAQLVFCPETHFLIMSAVGCSCRENMDNPRRRVILLQGVSTYIGNSATTDAFWSILVFHSNE